MRTRRRKRTYNGRLFRGRRAYSFAEIAERLGVHIRTVQIWRKEGLKILDDAAKPFLVMGHDMRSFLKKQLQSRKKPLKIGEFYCPRCREPRKSCPGRLSAQLTGRRLGQTHKQVVLRGICEVCKQRLHLFSSDRKITEWHEHGLIFAEELKVINGSEGGSVNTDMTKGQENGESKR